MNNPGIDLLLFSPSFEFSLLYYPSDPNSLPMLDMARYSWYRRYMLPWGDDVIGPRFSGRGETTVMGWYEDDGVIDWEGQEEGAVQLLTGQRFSGEAPMKEAMDHSTNGAAQYFLRHVTDTEAESTLGVYVPPGSTITLPAPTLAEEQRFTSVAPWIGLLLFTDDPGNGNQGLGMTPWSSRRPRRCRRSATEFSTRRIASDVAGADRSGSMRWPPAADTATQIANSTLKGSSSGGSPTALLRWRTGCAAAMSATPCASSHRRG